MIKKEDLVEKGAIVQRDRETYAIAPHIPGGIADVAMLRKIVDVAEKYNAKCLKLTSAQRIAIVGIEEKDLDQAWVDLGMDKGAAIGLCVRSIKICPGTTFCKRALQDSVALGLELDKKYHGTPLPSKFKIGVSGCPNSCSENAIKEIGIMGMPKGFTIMIGGTAGVKPRLADTIYTDKSTEETMEIVDNIINLYREISNQRERLGKTIDRVGLDAFKAALEGDASVRQSLISQKK